MQRIDLLIELGFTQVEAAVYYALLENSPQSGYGIARQIEKSRSNVYQALKSLENKGAIVQVQGSSNKQYQAVAVEMMLEQKEREFKANRKRVADAFRDMEQQEDIQAIYYLQSMEQVFVKANEVINQTRKIIFIEAESHHFAKIEHSVRDAISRGVIVALYTSDIESYEGAEIIRYKPLKTSEMVPECWPINWFTMAGDAEQFIICTTKRNTDELIHALYGGNRYLSGWIYSDMLYQIGFSNIVGMFNDGLSREEIWQEIQSYIHRFVDKAPGILDLKKEYRDR